MKKNIIFTSLISFLSLSLIQLAFAQDSTPHTKPSTAQYSQQSNGRLETLKITMVIKVLDLEGSIQKIRERLDQYQAFPKLIHHQRMVLRMPNHLLSVYAKEIESLGIVIDKQLLRNDLTEEIKQLEGGIKSKAEILNQLQKLLSQADMQGTLEIERQMRAMLRELEALKGRLKLQIDQVQLATIDISFTLPVRQQVNTKLSVIPLLNDMGVEAFLSKF
jgi:hypothetical protein